MSPLSSKSKSADVWRTFASLTQPICEAFERSAHQPTQVQQARLQTLLRHNRQSTFGQTHHFESIGNAEDFRRQVPIQTWHDIAPWVDRIEQDDPGALTSEPPIVIERTSGSGAEAKHIPYTRSVIGEFQQALLVWLAGLYAKYPRAALGKGYWALSPATTTGTHSPTGIAIGQVPDSLYFAESHAQALASTLVTVDFSSVTELNDWRIESLKQLVEVDNLSLISVWSPTFLSALVTPIMHGARSQEWESGLSLSRRRQLDAARNKSDLGLLWPQLALISCWMDGPSKLQCERLQEWFPAVEFSGKGLLATEGVVSFPIGSDQRKVLAINSHVYEFVDDGGEPRWLDELELGQTYRPLLTTAGGLYRYRLGDVVEVDGWYHKLPTLQFVGREDARVDLVGEKLDETLVKRVFERVCGSDVEACLIPVSNSSGNCYVAVVPVDFECDDHRLAARLDLELCRVFHYQEARNRHQLMAVKVIRVDDVAKLLWSTWEIAGGRAGDFKITSLVRAPAQLKSLYTRLRIF